MKAYFTFNTTGLSVQFMDRSTGIITEYLWDFGYKDNLGNWVTSNQSNPNHQFPESGEYLVKLKTTFQGGVESVYVYPMVISEVPVMATDILGQVEQLLPMGMVVDLNFLLELKRKWQLYFQTLVDPSISDADVFKESKWPPLANVLIAKLIVYDMINKAANATIVSMANFGAKIQTYTQRNTVTVADYSVDFDADGIFIPGGSITVQNLTIDGLIKSSGALNSLEDLLNWMSQQGGGNFFYEDGKIHVTATEDRITTFNYTSTALGGTNSVFLASNIHLADASTDGTIQQPSGNKGQVKRIETGPSVAEWYDTSDMWMKVFRGSDGQSMMQMLKEDICMYLNRLKLWLPICPRRKNTILFKIAKKCK